jgi:hypothetical protein
MTQEFVKQNNTAVAASLLLLDALNHPEMQKSAWFNSRNIKKTFLTKKELELMWQKVEKTDDADYEFSLEEMKKTLQTVIDGAFESDAKGQNRQYIDVVKSSGRLTDMLMQKVKGIGMSMKSKMQAADGEGESDLL